MSTLDELGREFGTDKASGSHDYLRWYEPMLPARHARFNLLEMGVGTGNSLKMWEAFFPSAQIIGMDIEDKTQYDASRIRTVRGDQSNPDHLDRALSCQCGAVISPLVINDDAGHQPDYQLFAFKYLIPKLAPGGLYLLEDIGGQNVTEFLARLAMRCVHADWGHDGDEWVREYGPRIESVAFYRETSATRIKP